jgi:hypothetical protein
MEKLIKLIEEKLESNEQTIHWQRYEIEDLKRKLAEAEKTIEEQSHVISDLKGETA